MWVVARYNLELLLMLFGGTHWMCACALCFAIVHYAGLSEEGSGLPFIATRAQTHKNKKKNRSGATRRSLSGRTRLHLSSASLLVFAAFAILFNGVAWVCVPRFFTGAFVVALCPLLPVVAGSVRSLVAFCLPTILLAYASFIVFGSPWDLSAELPRAAFVGVLCVGSIWRAWRLER